MAKNVVQVAGIFGESFLEVRCLGKGTTLVGNDDDERECMYCERSQGRQGMYLWESRKMEALKWLLSLCLPRFVHVAIQQRMLWVDMPVLLLIPELESREGSEALMFTNIDDTNKFMTVISFQVLWGIK